MRKFALIAICTGVALAGPPLITELQPRGAERGHTFLLTIVGRDIPDGARIWSTMPASFTPVAASQGPNPMMAPGRSAQFLVESTASVAPGIYPIRLQTQAGISNILLFSVGAFPEVTEQESLPYSPPNRNDSIETAEAIQNAPVTINGTLRGPERDVYRIHAKAGETRVFEVEARRCGSAVDPVLTVRDGSGKQLARSDDSFGAGLDPRLQFTFPREGYYYVEVNDARFSRQAQNFYRLTMGAYSFADGLFPLGGKRGEATAVTFFGGNLKAPVKSDVDLRGVDPQRQFTTATAPNSPTMPFLFAVSDYPELIEPSAPVSVPAVINGRLSEPGKINHYKVQVQPGDKLLVEVQARELGTSRLEAILTAYDGSGKKIDSAGDKPLPEDVFAVQGVSRTSSDPFLEITAPQGAHEIALSIEDLALRGGPQYGYRIVVRKQPDEFQLSVVSPYINIPSGGTAVVVVDADRRGYNGPIELSVADLPKGIRSEGGTIPREHVDANNARTFNRRGMLILSADPGVTMPMRDLQVWGAGKLDDGTVVRRRARGVGLSVDVVGATAQGVVDRQRPVTARWMGLDLPAASAPSSLAKLEVTQAKVTHLGEGDRYDFTYKWDPRSPGVRLPDLLGVDVVGARDIRVTAFEKSGMGGSFSISTTKATDPARYDIIIRGRVTADGVNEDVYARPLPLIVTERSPNVQVASH